MPSYISDSRLNGYEAAFCGATAGVISRYSGLYIILMPFIDLEWYRAATGPLDVVKIRFQLQPHRTEFQLLKGPGKTSNGIKYTSILPALKTILREEGIRVCMHNVSAGYVIRLGDWRVWVSQGLYKGNLAAEYLYLLYNAVEFCAYREIELTIEKMVIMINDMIILHSHLYYRMLMTNYHDQERHLWQACLLVPSPLLQLIPWIYFEHDLLCKELTRYIDNNHHHHHEFITNHPLLALHGDHTSDTIDSSNRRNSRILLGSLASCCSNHALHGNGVYDLWWICNSICKSKSKQDGWTTGLGYNIGSFRAFGVGKQNSTGKTQTHSWCSQWRVSRCHIEISCLSHGCSTQEITSARTLSKRLCDSIHSGVCFSFLVKMYATHCWARRCKQSL